MIAGHIHSLLRKDLMIARGGITLLLIGFVAMFFPLIILERSMFFPLLVFPIFLSNSGVQIDASCKTEALLCSLPLKRSTYVWSRYVMALLAALFFFLLGVAVGWLISRLFPEIGFDWRRSLTLPSIFSWLFPVVLVQAVFLPCYFKFGYGKGWIAALVGTFVVSGLLAGLAWMLVAVRSGSWSILPAAASGRLRLSLPGYALALISRLAELAGLNGLMAGLAGIMVALVAVSILLSLRFFRVRDL